MQRVGKLTLGLVLIVLGSAKLWDVFKGQNLTAAIVQYWPAVLVFFGLEYLWANKNPDSKARLHWGAVFLTFLIVIVALGMTRYGNFLDFIDINVSTYNAYRSTIPVKINYPVDAGIKRLEIEAIGDITLTGQNTAEITGQGSIGISARSEEYAKKAQESVRVEKDLAGDTLIIRVFRANDFPKNIGVMVSLNLAVPSSLDVKVKTVSGDVSIEGLSGNLDLSTVSGNVDVKDDLAQSMTIRTVSGDVEAILSPSTKAISVKTTSGDIEIQAPQGTGGRIQVRTLSGDIDIPRGNIDMSSSPGSHRASGTFGTGQTDINIETVSGDVKIR